jgi:hypothetical protein
MEYRKIIFYFRNMKQDKYTGDIRSLEDLIPFSDLTKFKFGKGKELILPSGEVAKPGDIIEKNSKEYKIVVKRPV